MSADDWEARVSAVRATASVLSDDEVLSAIDDLVAECDATDAAAAFLALALALAQAGRTSEALGSALDALAPHLTQYGRSVAGYAEQLE